MTVVREDVRIEGSDSDAFRLWTDGIGEWWPLEEGYAYGGDRTKEIYLEAWPGGRFYERFVDGDTLQVGRVLECEPPRRILFTWKAPDWRGETEVEVTFVPEGTGTRVAVEHRGFERIGPAEQDEARRFGGGWPRVMQAFAAASRHAA
jgi:uncharacterized protein YndB with AHSA1/START domain